jgi:hypothetical protein
MNMAIRHDLAIIAPASPRHVAATGWTALSKGC